MKTRSVSPVTFLIRCCRLMQTSAFSTAQCTDIIWVRCSDKHYGENIKFAGVSQSKHILLRIYEKKSVTGTVKRSYRDPTYKVVRSEISADGDGERSLLLPWTVAVQPASHLPELLGSSAPPPRHLGFLPDDCRRENTHTHTHSIKSKANFTCIKYRGHIQRV